MLIVEPILNFALPRIRLLYKPFRQWIDLRSVRLSTTIILNRSILLLLLHVFFSLFIYLIELQQSIFNWWFLLFEYVVTCVLIWRHQCSLWLSVHLVLKAEHVLNKLQVSIERWIIDLGNWAKHVGFIRLEGNSWVHIVVSIHISNFNINNCIKLTNIY